MPVDGARRGLTVQPHHQPKEDIVSNDGLRPDVEDEIVVDCCA
jgi:hypothetical protein